LNVGLTTAKQPGHDKSIAAVIAFSAEDRDALPTRGTIDLFKAGHEACAGAFHQHSSWDTGFADRPAIEFLHLRAGDDLCHCGPVASVER
jgi:hypothetical protein